MERVPVSDSTQVASYGYDENARLLELEFLSKRGNSVYQYQNVSPDMWTSLLRAPSKGRWVKEHLKANPSAYPYRKVG